MRETPENSEAYFNFIAQKMDEADRLPGQPRIVAGGRAKLRILSGPLRIG